MSEKFYANARLYDLLFGTAPGTKGAHYLALAQASGGSVLELACGTGSMLIPIASSGIPSTGLDFSEHMLTEARRKLEEAGTHAKLLEGNMAAFDLGEQFDLIFIASNSLLHLHETRDLLSCMRCVRRHLRDGGRFAFDVFNPNVQILVTKDGVRRERQRFLDPDRGEVRWETEGRYDPVAQVTREMWYFSTDEAPDFFSAPLEIRNIFPQELSLLLEAGGFRLLERYGDFQGSAFAGDMPTQVCICEPITPPGRRASRVPGSTWQ